MHYAEATGYVEEKNNSIIHQQAKDWLKSLRPQSHWKPTAEQMKVLKETCVLKKSTETGAVLCELYHDLEKLREE